MTTFGTIAMFATIFFGIFNNFNSSEYDGYGSSLF